MIPRFLSLENLNQITPQELAREDTFNKIADFASEIGKWKEPGSAYEFLNKLGSLLKAAPNLDSHKDLFNKYKELIIKAKFLALPLLSDEAKKGLFEKRFLFAIKNGIDLNRLVDLCLILYNDEISNYGERRKILSYLANNQEKIGQYDISEKEGGAALKPTIANWLHLYDLSQPIIKRRGSYERSFFVSQNKSANKLSSVERDLLLKVLSVYDHARFVVLSPLVKYYATKQAEEIVKNTPKGMEVRVGDENLPEEKPAPIISERPQTIEKPVEKDIEKKSAVSGREVEKISQEEIIKLYKGDKEENRMIEQSEKDLAKATGRDYTKLKNILDKLLNPSLSEHLDKVRIIAALKLLARIGKLDNLLEDDQRFADLLIKYFKAKKQEKILSDFEITPKAPQFLSIFLQIILKEKLGMDESSSARVGLQLANLLKEYEGGKYDKLAYFDVDEGKFRWGI